MRRGRLAQAAVACRWGRLYREYTQTSPRQFNKARPVTALQHSARLLGVTDNSRYLTNFCRFAQALPDQY